MPANGSSARICRLGDQQHGRLILSQASASVYRLTFAKVQQGHTPHGGIQALDAFLVPACLGYPTDAEAAVCAQTLQAAAELSGSALVLHIAAPVDGRDKWQGQRLVALMPEVEG